MDTVNYVFSNFILKTNSPRGSRPPETSSTSNTEITQDQTALIGTAQVDDEIDFQFGITILWIYELAISNFG